MREIDELLMVFKESADPVTPRLRLFSQPNALE